MRLCLLIGLAMTSLAAYNWISWSCLTASDWGTWVGAVGTVGTLIWTSRLATATERRRIHDERRRALVASSALRLRVTAAEELTSLTIASVYDPAFRDQYLHWADLLQRAPAWTDEEILPLMFLRGSVMENLAACRDILGHCAVMLVDGNPRSELGPRRDAFLEGELLEHLATVRNGLRRALLEFETLALTPRDVHY